MALYIAKMKSEIKMYVTSASSLARASWFAHLASLSDGGNIQFLWKTRHWHLWHFLSDIKFYCILEWIFRKKYSIYFHYWITEIIILGYSESKFYIHMTIHTENVDTRRSVFRSVLIRNTLVFTHAKMVICILNMFCLSEIIVFFKIIEYFNSNMKSIKSRKICY